MNEGCFPLSFMQRFFWLFGQLEPNAPAYNLLRALKITGELDISALGQAFRTLLRRHDVLRTGFFSSLGGDLSQCFLDNVKISVTTRNISSLREFKHWLEPETFA